MGHKRKEPRIERNDHEPEVDLCTIGLRTARRSGGKEQGIGAIPFGEQTIEMKPGVGRPPYLFFAPGPTGATAPAIFRGEICRSYSWHALLVMIVITSPAGSV